MTLMSFCNRALFSLLKVILFCLNLGKQKNGLRREKKNGAQFFCFTPSEMHNYLKNWYNFYFASNGEICQNYGFVTLWTLGFYIWLPSVRCYWKKKPDRGVWFKKHYDIDYYISHESHKCNYEIMKWYLIYEGSCQKKKPAGFFFVPIPLRST